MAVNDLDIKVRKVANRYKVDVDDLVKKVQMNRLIRQGLVLDRELLQEDIKQPSKDLNLATDEIEEFIKELKKKRR